MIDGRLMLGQFLNLDPTVDVASMKNATVAITPMQSFSSTTLWGPATQDTWTYFATRPMDFVNGIVTISRYSLADGPSEQAIIKFERDDGRRRSKLQQPLVAVQCSAGFSHGDIKEQGKGYWVFPFYDPIFDSYIIIPSNSSYFAIDKANNTTSLLTFPDNSDFQDQVPVPLSSSMLLVNPSTKQSNGANDTQLATTLCLIHARWVEAELWADQYQASEFRVHLGFDSEQTSAYLIKNSNANNTISITREWLRGVGMPDWRSNATFTNPAFETISSYCVEASSYERCYSNLVVLSITSGLAYVQDSDEFDTYSAPGSVPSMANRGAAITGVLYRYRYAYGFGQSITVVVAFSLLLLHVGLAFVHMTVALFSRHSWRGSSWESLGQMVVFALQSKSLEGIRNAEGGAVSSKT